MFMNNSLFFHIDAILKDDTLGNLKIKSCQLPNFCLQKLLA